MQSWRSALLWSSLIFLSSTAVLSDSNIPPESTVNQFYSYHFSHEMGFTPEEVEHRSKWLTPSLVEACRAYFAMPQDPDEAPEINGDPFTGTQEYPNAFSVEHAGELDSSSAKVPVTFTWKEGPPRKAVVVLKKQNGQWLIDDVQFPDQEALRKMLQDALGKAAE